MNFKDFENMNRIELENFLDHEELHEEQEVIMASIELGKRDKNEGRHYSTIEVLKSIFERGNL